MGTSQVIFLILTAATFGFFGFTAYRIFRGFKFTKKLHRFDKIVERVVLTLKVAFGQTKMFKRPVAGLLHALVYWGFLVITIGTVEMVYDGIAHTERVLKIFGGAYKVVTWSGEVFASLVIISCIIFLIRRYFVKPKRFTGVEMKPSSTWDATLILGMILLLMFSLIGMNIGYVKQCGCSYPGGFPVSKALIDMGIMNILPQDMYLFEDVNWWIHITLVYAFLNILPY